MNEGVQRMIINPDGNIGIGTITALPNDTLDVLGGDLDVTGGGLCVSNGPANSDCTALDVSSTTQGLLPPVMTTIQREDIILPAEGLIIYNTDTKVIEFYNDISWVAL